MGWLAGWLALPGGLAGTAWRAGGHCLAGWRALRGRLAGGEPGRVPPSPPRRRVPVYAGWGSDVGAVDWAAADVWQLGCCLWELLIGRPAPYYGLGRAGVTLADLIKEVGGADRC